MDTGTIKMFNMDKGFGFIKPDHNGPDVFLHITAAKENGTQFNQGQKVQYAVVEGRDGRKAAGDVEVVE